MAEPDSVRVELAFDGGPGLSALVTVQGADELERALATEAGGTLMLDSNDGRYTIVLRARRLHEALRNASRRSDSGSRTQGTVSSG